MKTLLVKIWKIMPLFIRLKITRFAQAKFTVSVVGIITNEKNEVLILDHFFRPTYSWGLPGGYINANEPPNEALRREIREEAGLELKNINLIYVRTIQQHIEILFRAEGFGKAEVKSMEIREVGWFPLDNLPEISQVQIDLLKEYVTKN